MQIDYHQNTFILKMFSLKMMKIKVSTKRNEIQNQTFPKMAAKC